tara:strand:+ start:74 stop:814 length:741 start_codon:yes stop_codon:yes gene_type:complete
MVLGRVFCSEIKVFEWSKECDFDLQGNFHVWRLYIPGFVSSIEENIELLTSEELEKSSSFVHQEDRYRFVLGKIYLRKLIAKYLKIDPKDVRFGMLEYNKPYLLNMPNLNFNISHSGDFLIIGITNRWPLGVDLERMNSNVDLYNLIYSTMSSTEIGSILNSHSPREIFYKHWTRKEAFLKGVGIGLTDRLKDISCNDGLNLVPSGLSSFASSWNIRSFTMDNQYMISIAHDSAIRVVRFYELNDI